MVGYSVQINIDTNCWFTNGFIHFPVKKKRPNNNNS